MANRSYLYALDFDRTERERERKNGEKICGLAESAYNIPLSFRILVSQNSKVSHSINWDYEHPIAIQGDFKLGHQRLITFLNQLKTEPIFDSNELEKRITETDIFLTNQQLQNIILECGEIYEMGDGELEDQNADLFEKGILPIESEINEYLIDFRNMKNATEALQAEISELSKPKSFLAKLFTSSNTEKIQTLEKKIDNIKSEMWRMLGITEWSDVLYYDFNDEEEE